jgi:hypothetical protein
MRASTMLAALAAATFAAGTSFAASPTPALDAAISDIGPEGFMALVRGSRDSDGARANRDFAEAIEVIAPAVRAAYAAGRPGLDGIRSSVGAGSLGRAASDPKVPAALRLDAARTLASLERRRGREGGERFLAVAATILDFDVLRPMAFAGDSLAARVRAVDVDWAALEEAHGAGRI